MSWGWRCQGGEAVLPTADGLAPLPTSGVPRTRSGGQLTAQAPVQALIVPESRSKRYSVCPCRSTRTSPSPVLDTPTLAGRPLFVVGSACDAVPPQPTSASTASGNARAAVAGEERSALEPPEPEAASAAHALSRS